MAIPLVSTTRMRRVPQALWNLGFVGLALLILLPLWCVLMLRRVRTG